MGVPLYRWIVYFMENPHLKWMTGCSHMLGKLHRWEIEQTTGAGLVQLKPLTYLLVNASNLMLQIVLLRTIVKHCRPSRFLHRPPITSHSPDPAKYFPNPLGHSSQFMKKPMVRAYFPNILSSHCKCQIFRYRHHGSTRSLSGGSKRKVCLHELMVGVFNSCILQNSLVARLNQILPDWIAAILI